MANELTFDKVAKQGLADQVIEQLKTMILTGQLSPGDKLPPERDLAASFGVSRASVREAIHSLSTMGILEARVGDGTYICDGSQSALNQLSWAVFLSGGGDAQLKEARRVIEPAIAQIAAEKAAPQDIARLKKILKQMEASLGDPAAAAEADFAFHVELSRIAGNEILQGILVGLQWMLRAQIQRQLREDPSKDIVCYNEHRDILKAIEAGDAKKARKAMKLSVNESKLSPDGKIVKE
ncbi:MAG: FadR family transcriptional regulator [Lachnospiraceae bacterium]|nr:FadR family transcriptional regulator [Lachnospiraceae bacterium]